MDTFPSYDRHCMNNYIHQAIMADPYSVELLGSYTNYIQLTWILYAKKAHLKLKTIKMWFLASSAGVPYSWYEICSTLCYTNNFETEFTNQTN